MKIVYQGDLHLRDSTPVNRKDNYFEAQLRKLEELVWFANDNDALLVLGGDVFDTYKVSSHLLNRTTDILNKADELLVTIMGQHDVPYHDMDLLKSPVGSLVRAKVMSYLEDSEMFNEVIIHAASWEQTPTKPEPGKYNILLGHISVFKEIPFYWKGEGYTPKTLREKYPGYDLYLCGDIHIPLVDGNVIVSGSMMRMSINQANEKPRAYLIDTETGSVEPLYYTIEKDVFTVKADETTEELKLDDLVLALKESASGDRNYQQDCLTLSKKDKPVNNIIKGIFDELD